ncbi:adenosine deaminase family protein [Undibacterium macrobrachii]|uniref:Adenosine deaminase n=1 Tax=Undibacterium macrobrachii TaxID=1119058 RepID=A0ABQ2XNE2_9BURK|nr:adenosine deaminase [Undibacterium macrobrachii]GGX23079.1 adenosine deaminase [Undibacterium macrobrachii]
MKTQNLFKHYPKGELHVHLNGLVSTDIVRKLLHQEYTSIPPGFDLNQDLVILTPARNLETYLKPWEVLRLIPKSRANLAMIVDNAFSNLKEQNIQFVELRSSVLYLSKLNNVDVETALSWLIDEIKNASSKYKIKAGLILTVSRGNFACTHLSALLEAFKNLDRPDFVVGIDLAGYEDTTSPLELGYLFEKAKNDFGLNITIHAGETGNAGNILDAIVRFKADRIGHGTAAYKSAAVMELLQKNDICVEVCPISNRRTGAIEENEKHPVVEFIKLGVPFVICSDNPSIHASGLSDDYLCFYNETENLEHLQNMFEKQKKYSFIKGLT